MRLEPLRAACVVIEGNGVRVLCHPWLDDGIYYGAWAHYPPYDGTIPDFDYIYVSHVHADHMAAATMQRLPKKPVLIHKFKAKFLKKNIEDMGFPVVELAHAAPVDLGGLKIRIYAADDCNPDACMKFFGCTRADVAATQIDSMAIFDDGKEVYANVNDCPYLLSQTMLPRVRRDYPNIDVALVAYAGAGPYPQCFVMPPEQKVFAATKKAQMFMDHVHLFATGFGARQVFPFAGDYVLQGKLAELNEYRGIPSLAAVHANLEARGHSIFMKDSAEYDDPFAREDYIKNVLAQRKLDYEGEQPVTFESLVPLFLKAEERLFIRCDEVGFSSKTSIYIGVNDDNRMWCIPLSKKGDWSVAVQDKVDDSGPFIKMTVDARLLKRILEGPKYAHWNNAEIGSHITFERRPDVFERGISQLMSFFHA